MKTHRSVLHASLLSISSRGRRGLWPPVLRKPRGRREPAPQTTGVPRVELQVFSALRAHPLTAPYPIAVTWRKGVVVLSGGVGTKEVHDVAVRLAIAPGRRFATTW